MGINENDVMVVRVSTSSLSTRRARKWLVYYRHCKVVVSIYVDWLAVACWCQYGSAVLI